MQMVPRGDYAISMTYGKAAGAGVAATPFRRQGRSPGSPVQVSHARPRGQIIAPAAPSLPHCPRFRALVLFGRRRISAWSGDALCSDAAFDAVGTGVVVSPDYARRGRFCDGCGAKRAIHVANRCRNELPRASAERHSRHDGRYTASLRVAICPA